MTNSHDNWDVHWENFSNSANRNPAQKYRQKLIIKALENAACSESSHLLDIGSGQGDFLKQSMIKWPKASFLGFEMSKIGVQVSKEKLPSVEFLEVNLYDPPEAASLFEGWATHAVCSEVLEHVDDPVAFLRKASAYLSSGAKIIVTVPGGPMSHYDKHIGHRKHFTRDDLKKCLQLSGFTPVEVKSAGFPFFNLYRTLVILRGKSLIKDASANNSNILMGFFESLFNLLFKLNNSHFGWQVIGIGTK
jgi:trans-aconitate methyltransferase